MNSSFFKFLLSILALVIFVFYHWLTGNSQKQIDENFLFIEGLPQLSYDYFTPLHWHDTEEKIDSVIGMYENYADSGLYLLDFKNSPVMEEHKHFLVKEHTQRDSVGYNKWKKIFESAYVFTDYRCFSITGSNRYFYVSWTYFDDVKMYPLDYLNAENILKIRSQLMTLLSPDLPVTLKVLKKDYEDSTSLGAIQVYEIYNQANKPILKDKWSLDQLKTSSTRNGPMDWEETANPEFFLWYEPFFFKVGLFIICFVIVISFLSRVFMKRRKPNFCIDLKNSEK